MAGASRHIQTLSDIAQDKKSLNYTSKVWVLSPLPHHNFDGVCQVRFNRTRDTLNPNARPIAGRQKR
jgi:hypothetical protein